MDNRDSVAQKKVFHFSRIAHLEIIILSMLALNVFCRIWISISYESTINPGVALTAIPLSIFAYSWSIRSLSQKVTSSSLDDAQSVIQSDQSPTSPPHPSGLFFTRLSGLIFVLGLILSIIGTCLSWLSYQHLAFAPLDHQSQHIHHLGLLFEGGGVIAFWSAWTCRHVQVQGGTQAVSLLHFPISISIFSLPWEGILRTFDEPLQRISTDIAVFALDLSDLVSLSDTHVRYWDAFTIYSDHFYLIINETCAGVNLLLSMSLYALGFGWVMRVTLSRAWALVAYIIPLSIVFNGLRVAIIFLLGHGGSVALATGPWHEGSGYLCQIILFMIIVLINAKLDRAPTSLKRDPLT